jgi:hypothetical protein
VIINTDKSMLGESLLILIFINIPNINILGMKLNSKSYLQVYKAM